MAEQVFECFEDEGLEIVKDLKKGVKMLRSMYIIFVKEYNRAKSAGRITLIDDELEALSKLQEMWKNTKASTFKATSLIKFSEMKEYHAVLNERLLDSSETPVHEAWTEYVYAGLLWD